MLFRSIGLPSGRNQQIKQRLVGRRRLGLRESERQLKSNHRLGAMYRRHALRKFRAARSRGDDQFGLPDRPTDINSDSNAISWAVCARRGAVAPSVERTSRAVRSGRRVMAASFSVSRDDPVPSSP